MKIQIIDVNEFGVFFFQVKIDGATEKVFIYNPLADEKSIYNRNLNLKKAIEFANNVYNKTKTETVVYEI